MVKMKRRGEGEFAYYELITNPAPICNPLLRSCKLVPFSSAKDGEDQFRISNSLTIKI
jgi:hypothetical protein